MDKNSLDIVAKYVMAHEIEPAIGILLKAAISAGESAGNSVPGYMMPSISTLDYPHPQLCIQLGKAIAGNIHEAVSELNDVELYLGNDRSELALAFRLNLGATFALVGETEKARQHFLDILAQLETLGNPGTCTGLCIKGALLAHCGGMADLVDLCMKTARETANLTKHYEVAEWYFSLQREIEYVARKISSMNQGALDLYLHYADMLELHDLLQSYKYSFIVFIRKMGVIQASYKRLIAIIIALLHLKNHY